MNTEVIFNEKNYPIRANRDRDLGAGYWRGWGLEFGGMLEKRIETDAIFQEALDYARQRGSLLTAHKLANLYLVIRYALATIPGDLFEFGSYRGGSAVFMAHLLRQLGRPSKVYAFDTFQGMPPVNKDKDLHSEGDFQDADLSGLQEFVIRNKLSDHLEIVVGRFDETLPGVLKAEPQIALAHVDCDIYEPIKYLLVECESHYKSGAYVILDDPLFSSCIGAFDAMAETLIIGRSLLPEQVYPHLVFRPKGLQG